MKLKNVLGAIAIGLYVSLILKALIFPTQAFLVIDLVAGTNLSSSSPGVWQRVIGNPIYITVSIGIGLVAEFIGGYWVAKTNSQKIRYSVVLMVLSTIAANFALNFDHPIWFNLLAIIRVLIACSLGAYWCKRRMNKSLHSSQNIAPIAPPY